MLPTLRTVRRWAMPTPILCPHLVSQGIGLHHHIGNAHVHRCIMRHQQQHKNAVLPGLRAQQARCSGRLRTAPAHAGLPAQLWGIPHARSAPLVRILVQSLTSATTGVHLTPPPRPPRFHVRHKVVHGKAHDQNCSKTRGWDPQNFGNLTTPWMAKHPTANSPEIRYTIPKVVGSMRRNWV